MKYLHLQQPLTFKQSRHLAVLGLRFHVTAYARTLDSRGHEPGHIIQYIGHPHIPKDAWCSIWSGLQCLPEPEEKGTAGLISREEQMLSMVLV